MIDLPTEIIKTLRATPEVLDALTRDLDDRSLRSRPGPSEWAIIEVVAHMADVDERALARVIRMLTEDEPVLEGFDHEALAIARGYLDLDLAEEVGRYVKSREALVAELTGLDASAWARAAHHTEHGEVTVTHYAAHVAAEDVDHLAQIARILSALPRP